ncbi:bifunctional ADP-dependent NAD(P)H-hydrate dehydratase/NAD(P)H-hydrate epimerase [Nocardioides silvaticus]|uniref:Bifunctional NAD(P)H-hydrate repair enzyme n=1 Tax=Nocardioides silvaticus TaxID=2201891 RepID=A0A316TLR5_9ACTN|nr:bifunctional ADP-dependent NAD(P)H-hydrate dehydratase/NAD(P)H-hydrate epimerase [Nocardioides silvaticus]PWN04728.1 bifunctional ADP-dependent NAD(P)H-hydrate dehydratase/NAD(P)H-hydrate epimerase [Nocardioides silvaticus]
MIRAHTVEQVRAAEARLLAQLPEGALMQRAAHGLAHAVLDLLGGGYGRRVLLLVGSGDNGGDALYAGAVLARRGAYVEAWLLSDKAHAAGVAALGQAGGVVRRLDTSSASASDYPTTEQPRSSSRERAQRATVSRRSDFDVVVDGIVGIGGRPPLREGAAAALEAVAGVPVVAVDTPSGVDVDGGELVGPHVVADVTVTFGTHKVAHLVDPASTASGVVHLVDIGLDLPEPALEALQPADVAALVPRPGPHAQKYTRGVVGVRAGSAAYPGAALLCVAGAECGLAGMVRYVGDPSVADRVRAARPEVVGDGRVQAWVVGSGSHDGAEEALRAALADDVPLVVDADALAFADRVGAAPAVLTPHAGELAAMLGVERDEIEAAPLRHARAAAERYRTTVLLKGRHTLVAEPGRPVRVTTSGTPWLATAGAGDVLSGVIGALLAAGLSPYDAASVGSWLHGAAATLASQGGPIVAGDAARALPAVVATLVG